MKIGIVVGTNRFNSVSEKIALYYQQRLKLKNIESSLICLRDLPHDFAFSALYGSKNPKLAYFQEQIDSFDKIFFIIPEYNGSYPGVLKTFIDALRYPDSFLNKKIALVGLSSGAYGNTAGLSHISDVFSYLNANILGFRLKLNYILKHFQEDGFSLDLYANFVDKQIETFLEF